MDIFLISTACLCFIVTWIFFTRIVGSKKKNHLNPPPGNMGGWPILGDFFPFISQKPATSLGSFMETKVKRYGKIFKINVLGSPVIISVDEDFNRFVLKNDGKLFEHNFPKIFENLFGTSIKQRIGGETHRSLKTLMNHLFGVPRLQTHLVQTFDNYVQQTLKSWKEGVAFPAHEEAKKLSFHTILKCMLSLDPGDGDMVELRRLYRVLLKGFTSIPIDLPKTNCRNAIKARKAIIRIINRIMQERIQTKTNQTKEYHRESDYLDILLDRSNLPLDQIVEHILEMLFAGFDPSSNAIAMAIYLLAGCRKALEELKEEHKEIARLKKESKESGFTWEDFRRMEFTQCVIKETLRHGNISSYLHRIALTDVQYKGYDIPCGWGIVLNLVGARLDNDVFEKANSFDPWRWQKKSMVPKMMKNDIAFGEGTHKCVGIDLVKMELCIFLHHLVLNYEWEVVEPANPTSHFGGHEFISDLLIKVHVSPSSI